MQIELDKKIEEVRRTKSPPVPTSLEDVFIHLMRNNPKSAP